MVIDKYVQFIAEQNGLRRAPKTNQPGSFEHFMHHITKRADHIEMGSKLEDERQQWPHLEDEIDRHEAIINKHYGKGVLGKIDDHMYTSETPDIKDLHQKLNTGAPKPLPFDKFKHHIQSRMDLLSRLHNVYDSTSEIEHHSDRAESHAHEIDKHYGKGTTDKVDDSVMKHNTDWHDTNHLKKVYQELTKAK